MYSVSTYAYFWFCAFALFIPADKKAHKNSPPNITFIVLIRLFIYFQIKYKYVAKNSLIK